MRCRPRGVSASGTRARAPRACARRFPRPRSPAAKRRAPGPRRSRCGGRAARCARRARSGSGRAGPSRGSGAGFSPGAGKIRAAVGDGGRRIAQDRGDHVRRARAVERPLAGQHLVEDDAEGEDVGPRVDLAAPRLFRRHVRNRAEDLALARQVRAAFRGCVREIGIGVRGLELGEPEVQDLDAPFARHHHVARLQVPVHDAALVRGRQRVGERHGDLEESRKGETARRDERVEGFALHQLHGEKAAGAVLLDRVDGHDVGVIERGERAGLAFETGQALRVLRHRRREHLDRHVAAELRVGGPVHLAHPARADGGGDPVVTEAASDHLGPPRGQQARVSASCGGMAVAILALRRTEQQEKPCASARLEQPTGRRATAKEGGGS